jgi:crotonobetainyl-CoA:carnitine CoA-transferase CaiB-like acyl-CoA transferase
LLAQALERVEWLSDPAFADAEARRRNATEVRAALERELKKKDGAAWEAELSALGVPCGLVRDVGEAASFPHLADRKATLSLTVPGLPDRETVAIVNAGFQMAGDGPEVGDPPPRLDEHRQEILAWLKA